MYVNVCNSQKVLKRIPKFTCMHSKMQTPEIVHNPSLIFSVFLKLNTWSSKKKKYWKNVYLIPYMLIVGREFYMFIV